MSTWGNDSRLKLTEEAVTAFEQANPGITVQVENSEWGGYWDKLATMTAGNTHPTSSRWTRPTSRRTAVAVRCSTWAPSHRCWTCRRWTPRCSTPAKSTAPWSAHRSASALFSVGVNPDLLKQAGLKMPDDKTWTWDDLATMAATVTEKLGSEGVTGMDFFGVNAAEIGAWTRQHDQEVFPMEGQTAVTAETLQSYFEFAKQMMDTKATPPAGSQVEDTTSGAGRHPVRHEQGCVPPAVPHPDRRVRRRQREPICSC